MYIIDCKKYRMRCDNNCKSCSVYRKALKNEYYKKERPTLLKEKKLNLFDFLSWIGGYKTKEKE